MTDAVEKALALILMAEVHLLGLRTTKDVKIANALRRRLEPLIRKRKTREAFKEFLKLFSERKGAGS